MKLISSDQNNLSAISDGRLYTADDLVSVGCHDCAGCSACCRDMEGLFLDPLDIWQLTTGLRRPFSALLDREIIIDVHGGLFLPKMKMNEQTHACSFLDENGRCSVHAFRPGICRMFPLGRNYEQEDFSYFLQKDACLASGTYKLRIRKWLGIADYKAYHAFLIRWHRFTSDAGALVPRLTEESARQVLTYVLRVFYETPFRTDRFEEFYPEFESRILKAEKALHLSS